MIILSSNKGIRQAMIHKYGKKCMMEEAGIRNIPKEERKKIKGYRKTDEKLTYHHIKPKSLRWTSNNRKRGNT